MAFKRKFEEFITSYKTSKTAIRLEYVTTEYLFDVYINLERISDAVRFYDVSVKVKHIYTKHF